MSREAFEYLVEIVIRDFMREFLFEQRIAEKLIYDDVINTVFQTQFEIVLKQIAIELNNDAILDKLAETVYLNPLDDQVDSSSQNSIFINDLHSFLHACVFESTRMNLNVNRELYYELKQVLDLNR